MPWSLDSFGVAVETLRANPLRTTLSTLGVIIGVASLVAVLALGDGMERLARSEIERTTGVQTIILSPRLTEEINGQSFPRTDYPTFTVADAAELQRVPGITSAVLLLSGTSLVEGPRGQRRTASLSATTATYADFATLALLAGRFFTPVEADRATPVVVVSHKLADELSVDGHAASLLGRSVRVNGSPRRVIGVLAPYKGERSRAAYVPIQTARSAFLGIAPPAAPVLYLKAPNVEAVPMVEGLAQDWLSRRFPAWDKRVQVDTNVRRLDQVNRAIGTFKLFLGAITGISLIVGGIGIMNVLLASVTERTREIGVRRALGARSMDILWQLLSESVAITGVGSAIGVGLGMTAARGITAVVRANSEAQVYAAFSIGSVVIVVAAALMVGVSCGIYPAVHASRLSPIDAIRND